MRKTGISSPAVKHREKDLQHLWHPYTPMDSFERTDFPVMVKGKGTRLTDTEGRTYLDGISSWWCVNLGHSNPIIVNSIAAQLDRLQHSITGGMSHVPVTEAAELLSELTPPGLNRVYFASDGASSVEAALRIAIQYWWNLGAPEKREIISLSGGYHGDTLGTAGLGYIEKFHRPVAHALRRSEQAPAPRCAHCPLGKTPADCHTECFGEMEKLLERKAPVTAAVIAEPLCQGAAGIRIYSGEYIRKLSELCRRLNVLLILDEIAVGFGRTGKLFTSGHTGVSPDIMVLGKSLTGGYLPMSAAVVTEEIFDSFRNGNGRDRTFYHGHTFAGNPLASAAAVAAMGIFRDNGVPEESGILKEAFNSMADVQGVHHSHSLGWIGRVEVSDEAGGAVSAEKAARLALKRGLLIRPLGPVLYLWPPLVSSRDDITEMVDIFRDSLVSVMKG